MSRWPTPKAYFWQRAPLVRLLLPLVLGIICYDADLPAGQHSFAVIIVFLLCGLALVACSLPRTRNPVLDGAEAVSLYLFFAALGWVAYSCDDLRNRSNWFGEGIDTAGASIVRILAEPQQRKASTRATVEVLVQLKGGKTSPACGKALVYFFRHPEAQHFVKGDTILLPSRWQPVVNSGNPFAFDNHSFQRRKNIFHQQFLSSADAFRTGSASPGEAGFLELVHNWCSRQLADFIPDKAALGLLQAMLIGDESAFDPELREAYSQTGVIHIVSISGSHVAVLFLVVTGLLFWIRSRHGAWIKYGVGVLLVWLYVLVAGAPPSALRSAVMFTVIALSAVSEREGQSLNTVTGAAFILLLGEPAWLFSVGFQLSFLAVLSILLFYEPIYKLCPQAGFAARKLWQAVAASIAAEILTAPLVIYYFHNFPLLFIPANLLSMILVGFCALVGGMAVIALSGIPPLAAAIGWMISKLVLLFNTSILWLQRFSPTAFQFLKIDAAELALIYVLIAAVAAWRLRSEKTGLFVGLASACLLLIMLNFDAASALRQERLVAYQNGRLPLVEHVRGRQVRPLVGYDPDNYNARNAHTGWQAWRKAPDIPNKHYLSIKSRTILILADTALRSLGGRLPADVLLIARPLRYLDVGTALTACEPKLVVIAARASSYQIKKWRDSCASRGLRLHYVNDDGAYILE